MDLFWSNHTKPQNKQIYVFMCPRCTGNEDPAKVIQHVHSALKHFGQHNATRKLWLDVEQCDGCWNSDKLSNGHYIAKAATEAAHLGFEVGVYSSEGEWPMTVGSYSGLKHLPLWYAAYEKPPQANYNDGLYRFGGWSKDKVAMKQFADHETRGKCGASLDESWRP
jgi:hypothetical protein